MLMVIHLVPCDRDFVFRDTQDLHKHRKEGEEDPSAIRTEINQNLKTGGTDIARKSHIKPRGSPYKSTTSLLRPLDVRP